MLVSHGGWFGHVFGSIAGCREVSLRQGHCSFPSQQSCGYSRQPAVPISNDIDSMCACVHPAAQHARAWKCVQSKTRATMNTWRSSESPIPVAQSENLSSAPTSAIPSTLLPRPQPRAHFRIHQPGGHPPEAHSLPAAVSSSALLPSFFRVYFVTVPPSLRVPTGKGRTLPGQC
jgi:hypothetical protein